MHKINKDLEKLLRKFEKKSNLTENLLIFWRDYGKNEEYNIARLEWGFMVGGSLPN